MIQDFYIFILSTLFVLTDFQTPKNVLLLLNPYSGEKRTRYYFNHQILPMFNTAEMTYAILEFHDQAPLKDVLSYNKIDLNDYYGLVRFYHFVTFLLWGFLASFLL